LEPIKKGQSRETGNIGYTTRRQTKQKQSRETGNIGYTTRRQTKQKYNTICVVHHCTHTNTNNNSRQKRT
jgi:predicted acetyltransferase